MQSAMQHQFSQVPRADIPRSVFNRTHTYKTTFDSGYLVPIYVDEVLPGETKSVSATLFARLTSPLNVPIMDNMFLDTFFFAVPLRLIWDNFPRFMGEQKNPGDSTDFIVPQIVSPATTGWVEHSLADYFGWPIKVPGYSASSFWHRAYNLIYNEWFRCQNTTNSASVPLGDSNDNPSDFPLRKRTKRHDYFTSCLPWPQKGPGVELPLGVSAPVITGTEHSTTGGTGTPLIFRRVGNGSLDSGFAFSSSSGGTLSNSNVATNAGSNKYYPTNLYADLSQATSATINSLRQAFQLQRLYERDARSGTRYTEVIRGHFGVVSPDARLQRPEYLGGSSNRIIVNPVVQQSESGTTPLGNLSAFGFCAENIPGFTKSFTEHCVIVGLANVRADLTYQQGLPRMFSRKTRFDYYWPVFAHLGEQTVLNKEIYMSGDSAIDESVFGYQERWAELRYGTSKITGKLRSNATGSLDVWHLSQNFANTPTLSQAFLEENVPIDRISAVTDEPEFILDSQIRVKDVKPLPTYSVPGMIDHL